MRNLKAEQNLARKLSIIAGGVFLLSVVALAVGTELIILDLHTDEPAMFWCWQGVWGIVLSVITSKIAAIFKKSSPIDN
jgi:hypothetical protein